MLETDKFITLDHPAFIDPKNTAVVFPGQGIQKVGMGLELYQFSPVARKVYDDTELIAQSLGFSIINPSFYGPESVLNETTNTQAAILTHSHAYFETLKGVLGSDFVPSIVGGFSLGEYYAMCVAGIITFWEMLKLVYSRGPAMQKAINENPGGKVIVTLKNKDGESVTLKQRRMYDFAINYLRNEVGLELGSSIDPTKKGLGGVEEVLQKGIKWLKAYKRDGHEEIIWVRIKVAGPYHTSSMEPAVPDFINALEQVTFSNPAIPVVANDGSIIDKADNVKDELVKQLTNPVMWDTAVDLMDRRGVLRVVEPGDEPVTLLMFPKKGKVILPVKCDANSLTLAHIQMSEKEAYAA